MKTFTQFINENVQPSQYSEIVQKLADSMSRAAYTGNVSVNPDNSIQIESNWELDTMKISGLGRIEPNAYFSTTIRPKFNKDAPPKLSRLIQLGLGSVASLIEGFVITTALSVEAYQVEGYEFKEGPNTNEYSLDDLEVADFFNNDDIDGAAESLIEWWNECANEYGYMLYTRVAEDLEEYIASHQPEEEEGEWEEEEDGDDLLESHDNFKRLHQLGLANREINIENLDGDPMSDHIIDSIKNDADEVSNMFGKDIIKIDGQISTDITMLLIYLADGSVIQLDAHYQTGPGYSNRDYSRLFIKSNNGEFDVVLREEGARNSEEDMWLTALEDYNSVLVAIMKLAKPYLNRLSV
jgi:hypothetical protein